MKASVIVGTLCVGLSLAVSAWATVAPDDEAIRLEIERALERKDIRKGAGPVVEVQGGVVTLTGKVESIGAKTKALELAMNVGKVVAVDDELEIAFAESDESLAEAVARAVNRYPFFTVYDDVELAVERGCVTLAGRVTMPFKSEEIEERVSNVMGVQSVTNRIQTLPTNIGDQRLRAALTYRIYGDPLFREYAFRAHPPVHIIVERGRVVLTGAVRSQVEKRKAEHIARSTFGVFGVENRLRVGD